MYLFTRAGRFGPGSVREAMAYIGTVTEKVHSETGLEINAWMAQMSPELGTCVWATFVDSLDELEAANDKLAVSDQFAALTEDGARLFMGPLQDSLATIVHGEVDRNAPRPSYVTAARAQAVNGRLSDAISGGVEIAEAATRISGVPTMFLVDATGPYGGCRWTTGFESLAALQRAEQALNADQGWLEVIDRVGVCYAQGASQSIYRRVH